MSIKIKCPFCNKKLLIKNVTAVTAEKGRCPSCQKLIEFKEYTFNNNIANDNNKLIENQKWYKNTNAIILIFVSLVTIIMGTIQFLKYWNKVEKISENTEFLFDCSEMMKERFDSARKIDIAIHSSYELIDYYISKNDNTSLRVFCGECKDINNTKLIVPFKTDNKDLIKKALVNINISGNKRPLHKGIIEAIADFNNFERFKDVNKTIIIITSGSDTCTKIQSNIITDKIVRNNIKVYFVALKPHNKQKAQLIQESKIINGSLCFANNANEFIDILENILNKKKDYLRKKYKNKQPQTEDTQKKTSNYIDNKHRIPVETEKKTNKEFVDNSVITHARNGKGSVKVLIYPSSANGKWRIWLPEINRYSCWYESDQIIDILPGSHFIEYMNIKGYITPENANVFVDSNITEIVECFYSIISEEHVQNFQNNKYIFQSSKGYGVNKEMAYTAARLLCNLELVKNYIPASLKRNLKNASDINKIMSEYLQAWNPPGIEFDTQDKIKIVKVTNGKYEAPITCKIKKSKLDEWVKIHALELGLPVISDSDHSMDIDDAIVDTQSLPLSNLFNNTQNYEEPFFWEFNYTKLEVYEESFLAEFNYTKLEKYEEYPVLLNGKIASGTDFVIGIDDEYRSRGWLTNSIDSLELTYKPSYGWAALFITVGGQVVGHPRPSQDFSMYSILSIEMKGKEKYAGECVSIGVKDYNDPDDGTEKRITLQLTHNWKEYVFSLNKFTQRQPNRNSLDLKKLYVVTEFVFPCSPYEGKQTIFVKNIKFIKLPKTRNDPPR